MSNAPRATITYERQADPQTNRLCGAAALSMVYRSFGKALAQAEIWPKIAKVNHSNRLAAATHLMTQEALNRGFAAVAFKAKHPLHVLRLCLDFGIHAILNHRLQDDLPTGHYTVLVAIEGEDVILHDPYLGPWRRVARGELLELWRPRYLQAEIAGNVLIALAAQPVAVTPCQVCGTVMPPSVECPNCAKTVPLQPAVPLGCMNPHCAARQWDALCCPFCDHTWTFGMDPPRAQELSTPQETPVDYNPMFAQLDKFCEHVLSLGAIAQHPDVRQQLSTLKATKEKLILAQKEELIRRQVHRAKLAQLDQKFKQDEEAILKTREEINKPAPPLDGNALGQDLVKSLGLEETLVKGPAVPPQPAVQPPAPRPAPPVRKPAPQDEQTPVEYEAPKWDTLDPDE